MLHDGQFNLLAALFVHRFAGYRADEDIQALALNDFGRLFGHLLGGKMRQQVGDDKLRVVRFVAHAHLNLFHLPIVAHAHHAAQLERNRRPLVFLDAAVIMRFEKRHAAILIQGDGTDVYARRVEMGGGQTHALRHAFFADDGEHNTLVAVDLIELVTGLYCIIARPCTEALGLGHTHHFFDRVALGLGLVKECLVFLGISLHAALVAAGQSVKSGLFVIKQLFGSHNSVSFA